MSFSFYKDIVWDGVNVYGYITGNDFSWGCNHGDYWSTLTLAGPNHSTSAMFSGIGGSVTLPFAEDDGDWGISISTTFYCDCALGLMVAGDGGQEPLVRRPTYVAVIGTPQYTDAPPAPYVYNINREILDQFRRPLLRRMFVHEYYDPNPPNAVPPDPKCTTNRIDTGDAYSNDYGIFGPDLYSLGGGPNPCALRAIQHFEVDGVPVTPLYRVTWRYSGVSVEAQ